MSRWISIGAESLTASTVLLPVVLLCLCRQHMSLLRKGMLLIFTFYLAAVQIATGLPTLHSFAFRPRLNLIPLLDAVHEPGLYLENTLLNILLFIPFGFFLPLLWRTLRSRKRTTLCGLAFSLSIELSQMFSGRLTDVDDLLTNTVGTLLGFSLAMFLYQRIAVEWDLHEGGDHPVRELPLLIGGVLGILFFVR